MAGIKVFFFFMYFSIPLWIRPSKQPLFVDLILKLNFIVFRCSYIHLVSLAFAGSIGMTFVILACALPQYKLWWPFFVVLFYVLCPIPTMIARRHTDSTSGNSTCMETSIFLTMGFLVSSFALPIVLARAFVIAWGACYLTLVGNIIVFLTILGFFTIFDMDDSDYTMW